MNIVLQGTHWGWVVVVVLAIIAAWLHGRSRSDKAHIATLQRHYDWLRSRVEVEDEPSPPRTKSYSDIREPR